MLKFTKMLLAAALVLPSLSFGEAAADVTSPAMRFKPVVGKAKSLVRSRLIPNSGIKSISSPGFKVSPMNLTNEKNERKILQRVTAGGTDLYGYLGYSADDNMPYGLYDISSKGYTMMWADPGLAEGMSFALGWLKDDMLCGFSEQLYWGQILGMVYEEIDISTGEVLTYEPVDLENPDTGIYLTLGCDTDSGTIYGYGRLAGDLDRNYYFMKSSLDAPEIVTPVKALESNRELCVSMVYSVNLKKLYGITTSGEFVTISDTGEQNVICKLDTPKKIASYITGLTYSQPERKFYWNANFEDNTSALYTIEPTTGELEFVTNFENEEEFLFLVSPNEIGDQNAIDNPVFASHTFNEGASSGSISFTLPSELISGVVIPADSRIEWTISIDDALIGSGNDAPGSVVTAQTSDLAPGVKTFKCHVVWEDKRATTSYKLYIGNDTPKAPAAVTLDENGNVSWSPVTEGVNDGYVNLNTLTYKVLLNGSMQEEVSGTSCKVNLPAGEPLSAFRASVIACCNGLESAETVSNKILVGEPMELPVFLEPTSEEADLFTTCDADGDGASWIFDEFSHGRPVLKSVYNPDDDADNWLFLPAVKLDRTDLFYNLKFFSAVGNTYFNDYLEVYIGKAPDPSAMEEQLVDRYKPESFTVLNPCEALFSVDEPGTYYIGLHHTAAPDQYTVITCNFEVKESEILSNSPGAVTGLKAIPATEGRLWADLEFNLPITDMSGNMLPEDAVVKAACYGVNGVAVEGAPGELMTAQVKTAQGMNTITVTTSMGDLEGNTNTTDVYTGIDIPNVCHITDAVPGADMMSLTLTWEPPTTGVHDGFINPDWLTYSIYNLQTTVMGSSWVKIASVGTDRTYTVNLEPGAPQDLYFYGVVPESTAGSGTQVAYVSGILGTPFETPMTENFDSGDFSLQPFVTYSPTDDYNAVWTVRLLSELFNEPSLEGYGLCAISSKGAGKGRIGIPRFTTMGLDKASVSMRVWNGKYAGPYRLLYLVNGMDEPEVLSERGEGDQFVDVTAELPEECLGQPWVQIYIDVDFIEFNDLFICDWIQVDGEKSGVSLLNGKAGNVWGGKGVLNVRGHQGETLSVFAADGKSILSCRVEDENAAYILPAGFYTVSVNGTHAKVLVK